MTAISGSIQLSLSFIRHTLIMCFLSNSPITDQSMANKHWTFTTPATPSTIYPYFPYILPFPFYFSCPQQHYTDSPFSPQLMVIIHLCPFIQILSKYNSNLFSSPQSPPRLETSLSFHLCSSHGFSEFVTQAQTHSVS